MRASEKTVKKKHLNHVAKKEGNNAGFVQVISELPGPSVQEMLKDEEFHPKTLISVERAVRMFSSFFIFFPRSKITCYGATRAVQKLFWIRWRTYWWLVVLMSLVSFNGGRLHRADEVGLGIRALPQCHFRFRESVDVQ